MKKNRNILIIALLLASVAGYLIYRNSDSSIREALRDFAVADTTAITKIFLADRNGHTILLERQSPDTWTLNGKFTPSASGIRLLLETIHDVNVRTRVARADYNFVVKELSSTGIKCEIYQHGEEKPMKVYYVGGSTQDVLGTYMMLENSSVPFVTEIQGFNGYLTPRYPVSERDWIETIVFRYSPEQIKNIEIDYNSQPEKSFVLQRSGNGFSVYSSLTKISVQNTDTVSIRNYISLFKGLYFEGWDKNYSPEQRDSLRQTTPVIIISVTDVKGEKKSVLLYPKPVTEASLAQMDSAGKDLKYDMDRMYAFVNDGKDLVTIQQYVFGKVLVQLNDFDLAYRQKKLTKH